jgi:hypothetical protein
MPVDIEYPLPGDIVGPVFSVGGSYDASSFYKPPANLPMGSNITVTLTGAGMPTITPNPIDLGGQPPVGFWNTTVVTDGGDYPDITIAAAFQIGGGGSTTTDTVEDVDVIGLAAGVVVVDVTA